MERITTAEAARRLGVSPTQVRRLVASGELVAERQRRPQGSRLVILWDAPTHAPGTHPPTPPDAPEVATQDATPRTNELAAEVAWLRERLERAEEERSELRRMLLFEQQTVAGLRAQLPGPRTDDAPDVATVTRQDAPAPSTTDDARGMHTLAHQLERKKPWWWLPGWRKQRGR